METARTGLSTIVGAVNLSDPEQAARVMPLVYDELRQLARRRLRGERAGHTLRPTALVHEVYVRLADAGTLSVTGRRHFLQLAAPVAQLGDSAVDARRWRPALFDAICFI